MSLPLCRECFFVDIKKPKFVTAVMWKALRGEIESLMKLLKSEFIWVSNKSLISGQGKIPLKSWRSNGDQ